jgi:hypothetical protein
MDRPDVVSLQKWIEYADWLEAENQLKWQEGFDLANSALGLMTDKRNALDEKNAELEAENARLKAELTTRVEAQATIIRDQGGWLAELKAQLHEVREIYTGMEGIPKNLYTTEAYLMYIIKQMYDAALEDK